MIDATALAVAIGTKGAGRSRRCLRHRRPGGHDGRRPRPALISVYCTADDLLPERPANARRKLSDAEVVTLCVAQVLMGIPSDRRFLRAAKRQLGHLFPSCHARTRSTSVARVWPRRSSGWSACLLSARPATTTTSSCSTRRRWSAAARRRRRAARRLPRCAATATRAATPATSGACACTWSAPPTGRRARRRWWPPTGPSARWRFASLPPALRGGETVVCDKGYAGREFAATVAALGASVVRPARRDEPRSRLHLAPIRQRIESVFCTCKDLLSLERHGARTPRNLSASNRRPACSRSRPASASTTSSAAPAAQSSTTPHSRVASII